MDYTGKLNKHEEYIRVLKLLEKKTKYIEIVLIDEKETNDLVENFREDIISTKIVSEWWGTITVARNKKDNINIEPLLVEMEKSIIEAQNKNSGRLK